ADGLETLQGNVQDLRKAHDALLAVELSLAALDLRHILPGESPTLGEILLSPAALVPECPDEGSEGGGGRFELVHAAIVRVGADGELGLHVRNSMFRAG